MTSPAAPLPVTPELPLPPALPRARRLALLVAGWISLGTGVLGMFLPLLPTTCFLLGAAWCFGRSSPALHRWMLTNRWFGRYLLDYKTGLGFPASVKTGSLLVMWCSMGLTVALVPRLWVAGLLLAIGGAVTWHLLTLPTKRTA